MPDLFDRLYPAGESADKIPVHLMRAALGDYAAGNTSRAEIVVFFSLDAQAQADLDVLLAAIDGKTALGKAAYLLELHDVMLIAESGAKYATKAAFTARMGLA